MSEKTLTPEQLEEQKAQEYAICTQRANAAANAARERGEGRAVIENDWAKAFEKAREEFGY